MPPPTTPLINNKSLGIVIIVHKCASAQNLVWWLAGYGWVAVEVESGARLGYQMIASNIWLSRFVKKSDYS